MSLVLRYKAFKSTSSHVRIGDMLKEEKLIMVFKLI
jgi:hypothetical protein